MVIMSFSMNPFQQCYKFWENVSSILKHTTCWKPCPFYFAKWIGFSYSFLYPLYCSNKVFILCVSQRGTMFKSENHWYYSTFVSWNQFHSIDARFSPYLLMKLSYSLYLRCLSIIQDAIFTGLLVISANSSSFGLLREQQRISCKK